MIKMKKALALVLALAFALSLSTMAFAADEQQSDVASAFGDIVDFAESITSDKDIFSTIEKAAADCFNTLVSFSSDLLDGSIIADVVDDFRGVLEDLGIDTIVGKIKDLFNNLKETIKGWYQTSSAAPAAPQEDAPDTGSSCVGIVAFATLSVASAAAFVCGKKKVA